MSVTPVAAEVQPHWLNKSQMATSLGISVQAFDKWGVKPVAKVGRSVYFTAREVVDNRLRHEIEKHQPDPLDPDQIDENSLEYERYRLTKAQADGQEFKNRVNEAHSVPTDFATFVLAKIAAEMAAVTDSVAVKMLRQHPEMTAAQLEHLKRELARASNRVANLDEMLPGLLNDYLENTTG